MEKSIQKLKSILSTRRNTRLYKDQFVTKAFCYNNKGQIILLRKPENEWNENTQGWDLPGGKVEAKERVGITKPATKKKSGKRSFQLFDVEKALNRELLEEIGLQIGKMYVDDFLYHLEIVTEKKLRRHIGKFIVEASKGDPAVQFDPHFTIDDIDLNPKTPDLLPEHEKKYLLTPAQLNEICILKDSNTNWDQQTVQELRTKTGCPHNQSLEEWIEEFKDFPKWLLEDILQADRIYQSLKEKQSSMEMGREER